MKTFSFGRFILATIAVTLISQAAHMADGVFGMSYYTDPQYASLWSKIMMPTEGPPPASFFYYSIAFAFITALLFVAVYCALKNGVGGNGLAAKGLKFGFYMFMIAGVPAALAMGLVMNMPLGLIGLWTAEDFAIKLLGGMATAGINK